MRAKSASSVARDVLRLGEGASGAEAVAVVVFAVLFVVLRLVVRVAGMVLRCLEVLQYVECAMIRFACLQRSSRVLHVEGKRQME